MRLYEGLRRSNCCHYHLTRAEWYESVQTLSVRRLLVGGWIVALA